MFIFRFPVVSLSLDHRLISATAFGLNKVSCFLHPHAASFLHLAQSPSTWNDRAKVSGFIQRLECAQSENYSELWKHPKAARAIPVGD